MAKKKFASYKKAKDFYDSLNSEGERSIDRQTGHDTFGSFEVFTVFYAGNEGSIEEATKHLINHVKNLGDQNPIMKEWSDQVLKNFDQWRKDDWFDNYERKDKS